MSEKESKEILNYLKRVDHKLTVLLNKPKKETWVKAQTIKELTGWDDEAMRRARNSGLVKFKKDNGFFYCLESIPELLIKKTA